MGSTRTYIREEDLGVEALLDELNWAYERGWQPADVLHVTARSGDLSDVPLGAAAVLFDAHRSRAEDRAPDGWLRQIRAVADRHPRLAALATRIPPGDRGPLFGAALQHALPDVTRFQVTGLAFTWKYLPRFTVLSPTPSQWPSLRTGDGAGTAPDPRILDRIRGLLSKAESTDFPEEAEALTAKAQELVTRYAVSAALLADDGDSSGIRGVRLHLDNPYAKEKVLLLTAIGSANRARTVWFAKIGIATVVGGEVELRQIEVLFGSLLVQATRAMAAAGTGGRIGGGATAFRRAFLAGYAGRIGERLREADARATVDAAADARMPMTTLAPILARRSAAVDEEFRRLFPATRSTRTRTVDAEGWHAGREAAESACLTSPSASSQQ